MPLFGRFSEIKNLHHNVYFTTLKATLSFAFALALLHCKCRLVIASSLSYLGTPVLVFCILRVFDPLKAKNLQILEGRSKHE